MSQLDIDNMSQLDMGATNWRHDTHTFARRHATANFPTSVENAYQGLLNNDK